MKAFSTTSEGWFVKHMDMCNVLFFQNKEFSLRIIFKIKWEIMKDTGIPYSLKVCIHLFASTKDLYQSSSGFFP